MIEVEINSLCYFSSGAKGTFSSSLSAFLCYVLSLFDEMQNQFYFESR